MEWINQQKRRFYRATICRDLLGDWVVIRDYGSLDTARGGRKVDIVADENHAATLMKSIAKIRARHGYQCISVPDDSIR